MDPSHALPALSRLLADPSLRRRLLATLAALLLFRLLRFIPIPGIDLGVLSRFTQPNIIGGIGLGDAVSRMSVASLSLTPFVTAWCFTELVRSHAGESVTRMTRLGLTLAVAALWAYGIALGLEGQRNVVLQPGVPFRLITMLVLMGGTVALVGLGHLISRYGLGQGVWLLLAVETVAELPRTAASLYQLFRSGALELPALLLPLAVFVGLLALIIFFESARREVPVATSQSAGTEGAAHAALSLPLDRVTILPGYFASFLLPFLLSISLLTSRNVPQFLSNVPLTIVLLAAQIILFTVLIAALVSSPRELASKALPGAGPSAALARDRLTANLDRILTPLTLLTAAYLLVLHIVPEIMTRVLGLPIHVGGNEMLILGLVALGILRVVERGAPDTGRPPDALAMPIGTRGLGGAISGSKV